VTAETWGKRPKKTKQKRDSWAKPKRGRKKKQWGVMDRKAEKDAKRWGREKKEGHSLLDRIGKSKKGGWLSKWLAPERVSLVKYYRRLDEVVNAGSGMDQLDEEKEHLDAGQQISRFIERLTGKRLSSGQINQVENYSKENKFSIKDLGALALKIFSK
jgi:hypothetical protein